MHIIKLDAIDSTNAYIKRMNAVKPLDDFTIVCANHQTDGRGQMGTVWESQESKNLMVSVYKDVSFVDIERHFYISIVVSLAIIEALKTFNIKKLKVKWPNDILSESFKIAGILIENVIKQNQLQASILGFGINVNQTTFKNLPNASSLHNITGQLFDCDEILHVILKKLEFYFAKLKQQNYDYLMSRYEQQLFRKNKPSTFKDNDGNMFTGIIVAVSNSGNLQIQLEDNIIKDFDLKAITLLY